MVLLTCVDLYKILRLEIDKGDESDGFFFFSSAYDSVICHSISDIYFFKGQE